MDQGRLGSGLPCTCVEMCMDQLMYEMILLLVSICLVGSLTSSYAELYYPSRTAIFDTVSTVLWSSGLVMLGASLPFFL
jgi:hypothetical protein